MKLNIIFLFGNILKIDFIKKVVKKLVGESLKIVMWVINVGNEYG